MKNSNVSSPPCRSGYSRAEMAHNRAKSLLMPEIPPAYYQEAKKNIPLSGTRYSKKICLL
jgi:hypothetical protein